MAKLQFATRGGFPLAWLPWLRDRPSKPRVSTHEVMGLPTTVVNSREDIPTVDVISRLSGALALIEKYTPHYFRHLQRDFASILVRRWACRGAYFPGERICLVELTFVVNRDFALSQVAASILHEGMHARLDCLGFPLDMDDRARQERFCRRAEIEFGSVVPDGDAVLDRARQALSFSDEEVAPRIDPRLAAERIAQVDREAGGHQTDKPAGDS